MPGTDGLLDISEIAEYRVEKVTDELAEGDEILVKVIGIDNRGKIKLSRKAALRDEQSKKANNKDDVCVLRVCVFACLSGYGNTKTQKHKNTKTLCFAHTTN